MKENEFKDGRNVEPLEKTMIIVKPVKPEKKQTKEIKEGKDNG